MAKQRRKRGTAGDKTICLPLADDLDYATLVEDREAFRQYLDQQIAAHPELFPERIEGGHRFHGWGESSRQQINALISATPFAYPYFPPGQRCFWRMVCVICFHRRFVFVAAFLSWRRTSHSCSRWSFS